MTTDYYRDIYNMCGIAGIIQADPNRYSLHHLQKMTGALAHRGPDGEHCWQNKNNSLLLGHRRLSIIDPSPAAAQPMHYLGRYSIVHNGEIYNYIELRKELEHHGYSFRTQSDTEVILAAYDHWDYDCVDYFDGMFAFAIWDEETRELFAARDRFGEKPFFYFFTKQEFLFASEMKALWAAGINRQMNLKMLFNYITIGYTDNPERPEETFFEDIFRLPPASRLFYEAVSGELTVEKYWDIDPEHQDKKITGPEAREKFLHLFSTSVQRRLRSDVNIGTSLSGGLDSSSIIPFIAALQYQPQTFTAIFPGFEKDEFSYASLVAQQFGLPHHTIAVTADGLVNDWEKFMYQQEEPVASASAYAQYKVFELAKQHNTTVLLDGQGADETLAGYHKYYKWYWQELFHKRRLISSGEIAAARKIGIQEKFGFKNIMASLLPDLASVILERQYLFHALNHEDLTREFVQLQSKEAYYTTPELSHLNGLLYFNTCVHGLEELLRYADRNSMAHGREVRLPFLSHELVSFLFTLPSHFKIRDGWTKWLLRQALQDQLPSPIVWRKDKVGFEPPQKQWMEHKRLREMIMEGRQKLIREKIIKPEAAGKPVYASSAYDEGNHDWRYLTAAFYT